MKKLGRNFYDKINGIFVWEKTNPQPSTNYDKEDDTYSVTNAYEYFIFFGDGDKFRANNKTKNIITTSINSEHFKGHGAVMKKEVCDFFINNFTKPNDIVLDIFTGMGTTELCCKEQGRRYIGSELSKKYFDMCIERIK